MPIDFTCPHCNNRTLVADQFAGQSGPCQKCGQTVTVPHPQKAVGAPAASGGSGKPVLIIVAAVIGVGMLGVVALLAALLLPAVQASREAARRMSCTNNLKQLAIAMHNYHDVYQTFPPAYLADENGQPMHSWRVMILPFLDQQPLYEQYDFNKPWDSPENAGVTHQMLPLYSCPSDPAGGAPPPTTTNYMVVTGPGTLFDKDKAARIANVRDGTSNTIMIVEVTGQGVPWAKPQDIDIQAFKRLVASGKASMHPGGLNVSLADGSVKFVTASVDANLLDSMLKIDDGK